MTKTCPPPVKGRLLFDRFLGMDRKVDATTLNPPLCMAVRDLFAGTTAAGTVFLECNKVHHNDSRAHEMVGSDGRTFTWR
jgi:hypothetical protein